MGSLCHWMPTEVADPVILVINGDEENVGTLGSID
jgi:hypothetical protein